MSKTLIYVRTYLTRFLIIVGILSTLISWYFISPEINVVANELTAWSVNIETFALFVGLLTVFSGYLESIKKRERFWQYHVYSMILIIFWIIFGVSTGVYTVLYQKIWIALKGNLAVAMLGQIGFFCVSGAYRTFRMKNFRTALFALCCVMIVAMNSPLVVAIFPEIGNIVSFFFNSFAVGGSRAVIMTAGLGGIVLGIRILLGLERGALRAAEEAG